MKMLFYDLETTGFGFSKCGIIQIGGIMVDVNEDLKLKPIDAINLQLQPFIGKMIDRRSLEITGITEDQIKTFMKPEEAFEKLITFLDKHCDKFNKNDKITLVGYNNLHFDNDFLRQFFIDNNNNFFGSYFWSSSIDVMSEVARYLLFYKPAVYNFKLGTISQLLNIKTDENSLHDGFYDIKQTFKIYNNIIKSGNFVKPFNEDDATEMFNKSIELKVENGTQGKKTSKFTEENAWYKFE